MAIILSAAVKATVLEWLAEQLEKSPLDSELLKVLNDHGWYQAVPHEKALVLKGTVLDPNSQQVATHPLVPRGRGA